MGAGITFITDFGLADAYGVVTFLYTEIGSEVRIRDVH
jgi:S-adenosylmethionine hydrolase